MNKRELLDTLSIKPKTIKKMGSATIITTDTHKYVLKPNRRKADSFDYLVTRNFNNFPKLYSSVDDEVEVMDYIENLDTPQEQRLQDLVYLVSLLHTKTTFYKNVDLDYIKGIYEDVIERENHILSYYYDLQNMIELEVYMSPANYLLIRNISLFYLAIRKSREYLDEWYQLINQEHKVRFAYIHGNLREEHFIENDDMYLISWDHSRIDLPIYDLEKFYRNSFLDISLDDILDIYQSKYPLKKEELYFLLALLLIPEKIDMQLEEYSRTKQVNHIIFLLEKTLIYSENNTNKTNYYTSH